MNNNPFDLDPETGFDKALFIKLSEQRKANKIQRKADTIEAVYNVLTPEQKKEIKIESAMSGKDMSEIMLEGFELYKKKHQSKK